MKLLRVLAVFFTFALASTAIAQELPPSEDGFIINDNTEAGAPTIYVLGRISEQGARFFAQQVLEETMVKGQTNINMIIDSRGGEVIAGFMMVDIMKMTGANFSCTVKGEADSMAFYLLQACDERAMTADSILLAHEPSLTGHMTPTEMKAAMKDLKEMAARMAKLESAKLKISKKQFNKLTRGQDWLMDAGIALEVGAVDTIVPGNKNIDVERIAKEAHSSSTQSEEFAAIIHTPVN